MGEYADLEIARQQRAFADECQRDHEAEQRRLAELKQLLVAGRAPADVSRGQATACSLVRQRCERRIDIAARNRPRGLFGSAACARP